LDGETKFVQGDKSVQRLREQEIFRKEETAEISKHIILDRTYNLVRQNPDNLKQCL
jgi:hypothetical protein